MTTDPQNPQYDPQQLYNQFLQWHNKITIGQPKTTFTLTELYLCPILGANLNNAQTLIIIWTEINLITPNTKHLASGLGDEQYQFNHHPTSTPSTNSKTPPQQPTTHATP